MEQAYPKRPGVFETAVKSWQSGLGAFLGMLPLFAIVAGALFGLNYAFPILETQLKIIRPASNSIFVLMVVSGAWVFALEKLALGLAAAPAALATMRHVLITDGWRLTPGALVRCWIWAAVTLVLSLGALYLSGLAGQVASLNLISLILKGFAVIVPFLMLMVFPSVAADEPVRSVAARLDKAFSRWDGNFWRIAIVLALTAGPGILFQRIPAAIILRRPGASADAVQTFDASLIGSIVQSALAVLLVVLVSAGVAWCYKVALMPRPARKPLGAEVHPMPPMPK